MKRFVFLTLLLLSASILFGQVQKGIVKTPTRRNVNGTITQGQYISNATVGILFVNNNTSQTHVSGNQGKFSFAVSSPYYVTSVTAQKGTFTFLDADFSKKERRYSANAIEVLVDDPDVLAKVREEAVAHERSKIRKQIRAKEDEIEALKEANRITTAEYNKMLGELSEYRQNSETIVHQIAEVYATTDFDQMDDFNRQLLAFVEDGNFASADSLLKTKGSKEEEFARIKEADAAIKKTKQELQLAEEYNEKDKESFSKRLYSEHLMYLQRPMMQDSALYCLKMRADLDTTNIQAVWEYTDLCYKQNKFEEWEKYGEICLRVSDLNNDLHNVIACSSNLGLLYLKLHNYDYSKKYYDLALENIDKLFQQNPDAYRTDLAMTQNNLGMLNYNLHDYVNCERYYNLALENRVILSRQNPNAHKADLAATLNNLGLLYYDLHNYTNSEKFYKAALENYEQLFLQNPDAYRSDLAKIQSNLGSLYLNLQNYSKCELYYKSALEQLEPLFQQNPAAYRSDLASVQTNLGIVYRCIQDYYHSEKYYMLALENRALLYDQAPDTYRSDLASTYWNIMILYSDFNELEKYDKYLDSALDLYTILYEKNPSSYTNEIVQLLNRKAKRLMAKGKLIDALIMEKKALDIKNED